MYPKKPIGEIHNEQIINFGNVFSFTLTAPAQLEPLRTRLLAFRHIQGLFSLTSSVDPLTQNGTCILPSCHFGFFGSYGHLDWGNSQLVEVMRRVQHTPAPVRIISASGYFRGVIRKDERKDAPWFWALEWNKSVRLIGWIGDGDVPPNCYTDLPALRWHELGIQDGVRTRTREQQPLHESEDVLFEL